MVTTQRRRPSLQSLATLGGYRAAALAARGVPSILTRSISPVLGAGAAVASPDRRTMIARHLRRADPTLGGARLRRAVQEAFDSSTRYWLESFRLPYLDPRTVERGLEIDGYQTVVDALDLGRGVILALPHLGGWEWAGRRMADLGHGITVVVEEVDPPELFEWFVDLRRDLGMNVVPLGAAAGAEVLAALKRNDIVCLLCDRDIGRSGVEVEFFGETTTVPAGPATLALRTGAPLLPTAVYFTDRTDGHLGVVRSPVSLERGPGGLRADVRRVSQALVMELEHLIRRAPHQWHLFQPNWPSDPGYVS
ncbi:MAG: phosphatidylinositol mannoside acyltransferase [Ilumatobacteraceae bacterium]